MNLSQTTLNNALYRDQSRVTDQLSSLEAGEGDKHQQKCGGQCRKVDQ